MAISTAYFTDNSSYVLVYQIQFLEEKKSCVNNTFFVCLLKCFDKVLIICNPFCLYFFFCNKDNILYQYVSYFPYFPSIDFFFYTPISCDCYSVRRSNSLVSYCPFLPRCNHFNAISSKSISPSCLYKELLRRMPLFSS